jgi:hypothetical protein
VLLLEVGTFAAYLTKSPILNQRGRLLEQVEQEFLSSVSSANLEAHCCYVVRWLTISLVRSSAIENIVSIIVSTKSVTLTSF